MKSTQSPQPQGKQSRRSSALTTDEVAGTSFRSAFAPCIAVSPDIRWGRSGQSPEMVSELDAASIRGFQGDTFNKHLVLANCF
jgi:beta-glucosidase-like glycosyl hydrolase